MELKDVKTSKQLEAYWEKEEGAVSRMVIDAERDYPNETEEMKQLLDKKNVVFINVADWEKKTHGEEACTAYLIEFPHCLAQGTTKAEALQDIAIILKEVLPFEPNYTKWLDVILTFEKFKDEKNLAEIISIIEAKYNISDNDIFI